MKSIASLPSAPSSVEIEEGIGTAKVFNAISAGIAVFIAAMLFGLLFVFIRKTGVALTTSALILLLLVSRIVAKRYSIPLASVLLVAGLWLVFTVTVWLSGGVNSVMAGFYIAITVMSGMLLGTRSAVIVAGLSIAACLGMTVLPTFGYDAPRYYPIPPWPAFLVQMFWFILVLPPTRIAVKGLNEGLGTARREIARRKKAEESLKEAKEHLENRVQERTAELQEANRSLQEEMIERKRAEEAVTKEQQRLYDVLETLPVYVCLLDSDYRMPFANRYFRESFGESQGRRCHDFLFDRTEPCESCETYTVMKTGRSHHWYWTGPNGRDYDIYDFPFIDADGSMLILEMGIDITERKRAEEELVSSAKEIEDLYNNAPCGYHSLDSNGVYVRINDTELSWLGYTRDEVLEKKRFQDLITPESLQAFRENFPVFRERGSVSDLEYEMVRKDGTILPVLLGATIVKDSAGNFAMSRGTIFDIGERKQAEKILRRANRALRVLSECNQLLVRATDEQGFLNDICRILVDHGEYRMAWIGFALQDEARTVHPAAVAGFEDDYLKSVKISWSDDKTGRGPTGAAIRTGTAKVNRNSSTNPDYTPWRSEAMKRGYVSSIALPLVDPERIFGALTIYSSEANAFDDEETKLLVQLADDVSYGIGTLKMRAEKQKADLALRETLIDLRRSNQDLQQFAYVASHDLQEPLRNVASCLQLLEKKYKNNLDAEADRYIHYAVESSVRMKALILDLLAYSRVATKGKPPERTDCEQVLDQTLRHLRAAISETGTVITHDPLPTVRADSTQLLQVFQNLIQNAIKFRKDESPRIHVSAVKNKNEWTFSVKDNGIGIQSEYLDRIFVIFQRLHKRSQYDGTGIGLALAKKVVERHGGRIWAESEPGVGTTFYFTLPDKGLRS